MSRPTTESVFHDARAIADPRERAAFLDRTCGDDATLRKRVERLLRADSQAAGFLESKTPSTETSESALGLERAGERIDRYRLLELIGEGGFGSVWMAEQSEPVKRRVALKIIKLGMDTRAVVARFEAERQALALMDHPSIAKVFDGGATANGRPYFVMELVKGVSITRFCDDARFGLRARLGLFVEVCAALQHAHHKGVIHRDIKPSNVLVSVQDGRALPKVIDFGIAKATGAELTEKTLFTGFHDMIGTPDYMAPEQATGSVDIDTRADVYSLGVLLYELLTGCKPLDLQAASSGGLAEVVRAIREEEPVKPSTRASTADDITSRAALQRALAPRELSARLRGDLDWIVLKALEKDRSRRYDTASALADDVERYLRDEPVLATPPSKRYLLAKYVRRHRGAVAAAAAIVVVLLGGIAASTKFALRAEERRADADRARGEADDARRSAEGSAARAIAAEHQTELRARELERVVAFQEVQLGGIDAESMGLRIRNSLIEERLHQLELVGADANELAAERAKLEDALRGANLTTIAADALDQAIFAPTLETIDEQFADQPIVQARLIERVARGLDSIGREAAASELDAKVLAIRERELGPDAEATLEARVQCAKMRAAKEQTPEAFAELQRAHDAALERLGADHPTTLIAEQFLCSTQSQARSTLFDTKHGSTTAQYIKPDERLAQTEARMREVVERWRRTVGDDDPRTLAARSALGGVVLQRGRLDEAVAELESLIDSFRRVEGDASRKALQHEQSLAALLMARMRNADAERLLRTTLERSRSALGDDHSTTLGCMDLLGALLLNAGRAQEAEPYFVEHLERTRRLCGGDSTRLCNSLQRNGTLRSILGQPVDAERLLHEACDCYDPLVGDDDANFLFTLNDWGTVLLQLGRSADALPVLRRAAAGRQTSLGPTHPQTLATQRSLGEVLSLVGKFAEADKCLREALAISERANGPDHATTRGLRRTLAAHARRAGELTRSVALYDEVIESLRRTSNTDGSGWHGDLAQQTVVALEARDYATAERAARECIEIRGRLLGESDWSLHNARSMLGEALLGTGNFDEARPLLVDSAEQLLAAQDIPATRAGQPDRAAEAAERVAKLFDALAAREPSSDFTHQADLWRERANAHRASAKP